MCLYAVLCIHIMEFLTLRKNLENPNNFHSNILRNKIQCHNEHVLEKKNRNEIHGIFSHILIEMLKFLCLFVLSFNGYWFRCVMFISKLFPFVSPFENNFVAIFFFYFIADNKFKYSKNAVGDEISLSEK